MLTAAQTQEPQFATLDHFEFYVSGAERSRDFFARIFGNTVLNRAAKRYLKLGSAYVAFEPPRANTTAASVDHVSLSVKGLEMSTLHAFLERRGITYRDYPSGRDTAILDPDGTRLQLSPENGWNLLSPPNFAPEPVQLTGDPVFRPLGLDHVVIHVSDLEGAGAFYQGFLGSPAGRDGGTTWFGVGAARLGIATVPAGERAGVRHVAVSVAPFESETATRLLRQAGAQVESVSVSGRLEFRDLDGFRLQVVAGR